MDDNPADESVTLFTEDGSFDVPGIGLMEGRAEVRKIIDMVAVGSGGKWRYLRKVAGRWPIEEVLAVLNKITVQPPYRELIPAGCGVEAGQIACGSNRRGGSAGGCSPCAASR